MKNLIIIPLFFLVLAAYSQDSSSVYKKRVLESTEVDLLTGYYIQDGDNAAVTGGIGIEKLNDFATNIIVSVPLNDDNVLTIDAGISAYSSASSSNLDPFDNTGASSGGDDDDDDDDDDGGGGNSNPGTFIPPTGSPWVASSGASKGDVWFGANVSFSHSSDDRNRIWGSHLSFASEFDYTSFGFGGGYTWLFNQKNTEFSLKGNIYLDKWNPRYPTELDSWLEAGQSITNGFFRNVDILDQNGNTINKNGSNVWKPVNATLVDNNNRNSYSISFGFSQIISKKAQFSVFFDLVQQKGWLSNPMQRVYFADKANYYIGNAAGIPVYTSKNNKDVFQLADDIERLPDTRFKFPFGLRFNYFINSNFVLRTYYRFYIDDWGIVSHTIDFEVPIKIAGKFTLYPGYRYYTQTAANYFFPYDSALSTNPFYTSDYDLSEFNTNQYSIGFGYTDIFTKFHISKLGLKNIDIRYSYYTRNTGFSANQVSASFIFVVD